MRVCALLLFGLAACGGEKAAPAGPKVCDFKFDRSFFVDELDVLPPGQGFDLNGDGKPDNRLGVIGPTVNAGYVESIAQGKTVLLFDFTIGPGLTLVEAPLSDIWFFVGQIASERGQYVVPQKQFDAQCRPTSAFADISFSNGQYHATTPTWQLVYEGIGDIVFKDVQMTLRFDDPKALTAVDGQMGGKWTLCGLTHTQFPGVLPGSLLDAVINNYNLAPDIDVDGDGIEQIHGDGKVVTSCTDGDGTVIMGNDCGCDPRMADAYSIAFHAHCIPAKISGVIAD